MCVCVCVTVCVVEEIGGKCELRIRTSLSQGRPRSHLSLCIAQGVPCAVNCGLCHCVRMCFWQARRWVWFYVPAKT